jgi:hypothetical protein
MVVVLFRVRREVKEIAAGEEVTSFRIFSSYNLVFILLHAPIANGNSEPGFTKGTSTGLHVMAMATGSRRTQPKDDKIVAVDIDIE